jgi:vacuolar iron transporter family protein
MADGLTVPFALAAGLSAAETSSQIIATAGLAVVAAGAIAMGSADTSPRARTRNITPPAPEHQEIQELRKVELDESRASFPAMDLKDLHPHR